MIKNKKGSYEYVLSKSIMLIFVISIMFVLYNLYNNLNVGSASRIAESEAQRLAKEIDDVTGTEGVSSKRTLIPNPQLKVGRDVVGYQLNITDKYVQVTFIEHPYVGITGIGSFGHRSFESGGETNNRIGCSWQQIAKGDTRIKVSKQDSYYYGQCPPNSDGENVLCNEVVITMQACDDNMRLEGHFPEE